MVRFPPPQNRTIRFAPPVSRFPTEHFAQKVKQRLKQSEKAPRCKFGKSAFKAFWPKRGLFLMVKGASPPSPPPNSLS